MEIESGVTIPQMQNTEVCESGCSRLMCGLLVGVAAYLAASIMVIVSVFVVFITVGPSPDNPRQTAVVFCIMMLAQFTGLMLVMFRVRRSRAAAASPSSTTAVPGPSAPLATAVVMRPSAPQGGGGGSEPESKGGIAMGTVSTTTTTTQVTTAPVGVFATVRNALNGMTSSMSASPADGAYSSLPSEESVQGLHPNMAVVTGVPVSNPIVAQQQGTTHWI